jgi:hypothetical protein
MDLSISFLTEIGLLFVYSAIIRCEIQSGIWKLTSSRKKFGVEVDGKFF